MEDIIWGAFFLACCFVLILGICAARGYDENGREI